jgi:hypothetical protein
MEGSLHKGVVDDRRSGEQKHFRDSAAGWRAPDQDHRVLKLHHDESRRLLLSAKHHRNQVYFQTMMNSVVPVTRAEEGSIPCRS